MTFSEFKSKYDINLDTQQEEAVQDIEGSNLILAVPGSGKTTTLIARLGYMLYCKNIHPQNILVMTYNREAANEMRTRFVNKFGDEYFDKLEIRTINSLSLEIVNTYVRAWNQSHPENWKRTPVLLEEGEKKSLLHKIYHDITGDYAQDSEIRDMESAFTYIKNFMLTSRTDIESINTSLDDIYDMYKEYQMSLKKTRRMDFDDQMVFAKGILNTNPSLLAYYHNRFKYVCVDEAQDTSKIQHILIAMIAKGNNVFMVGDEDQSIYGFRAAYPQALLNFEKEYPEPKVHYLENNYRSVKSIVDTANSFIALNPDRHPKEGKSIRGEGDPVEIISCNSVSSQYKKIVEDKDTVDMAVLYRNQESALPLLDLMMRKNIPFKVDTDFSIFYSNKIIRDILSFIRFTIDPFDTESFRNIYYKCNFYLKSTLVNEAVKICNRDKGIDMFEALYTANDDTLGISEQNRTEYKITLVENFFSLLKTSTPRQALFDIRMEGYEDFINRNGLDKSKLDTLHELAKDVNDLEKFEQKILALPEKINEYANKHKNDPNAILLSTIHSSKGKEYRKVYIIDVYTGKLPQIFTKSSKEDELEERRLFYVAMTRAKDILKIMEVKGKDRVFITDLKNINLQRNEVTAIGG